MEALYSPDGSIAIDAGLTIGASRAVRGAIGKTDDRKATV